MEKKKRIHYNTTLDAGLLKQLKNGSLYGGFDKDIKEVEQLISDKEWANTQNIKRYVTISNYSITTVYSIPMGQGSITPHQEQDPN